MLAVARPFQLPVDVIDARKGFSQAERHFRRKEIIKHNVRIRARRDEILVKSIRQRVHFFAGKKIELVVHCVNERSVHDEILFQGQKASDLIYSWGGALLAG